MQGNKTHQQQRNIIEKREITTNAGKDFDAEADLKRDANAREVFRKGALCGLAPMSRQSGRWTGRAFIAGGRAIVRHALYMPALVACRFNPDLKIKYDQLKAAGKAPKVAITAIMRKLIVLANALLKNKRKWTPKHACSKRIL